MQVTIYHNPRCSKSRRALELIRAAGIEPEIVHYLDDPPDAATLSRLLNALDMRAIALVRRGESAWHEAGLGDDADEAQVIAAMLAAPILIERPIVVCGTHAVVGRPPERVSELLGGASSAADDA